MELTKEDYELIDAAKKTIIKNYDKVHYNHTVACAVRAKSGKIYCGVNFYSMHGACAEQIAIGCAITNGEREFSALAAVRGENGEELLPPCGNCRQILNDYMPDLEIILQTEDGLEKIKARNLLPYAYKFE